MHTVKITGSPYIKYNKREDFRTAKIVAIETLDRWLYSSLVSSSCRPGVYYPGRIGEAIRRLSEDDRKLLEKLTSDDVKDLRPPPHFNPNPSEMNITVFRLPHEKTINS